MYDVIVLGAGPTGSTAANVLADKGLHILLVEKHILPAVNPALVSRSRIALMNCCKAKVEKIIRGISFLIRANGNGGYSCPPFLTFSRTVLISSKPSVILLYIKA